MPDVELYLNAFGIKYGLRIARYVLQNVEADHHPTIPYREYRYPVRMLFVPEIYEANPGNLLQTLRTNTQIPQVVYTKYGNPYRSDFGNPIIESVYPDGSLIVSTLGHAIKI